MTKSANRPLSSDLGPSSHRESEGSSARRRNPQTLLTSAAVICRARDEMAALTGYKVDNVSGFEKTDEGWRLTVTVVELRRIPASTDILATYEATLNQAGDLINYHRGARYLRSQVGEKQ